MSSSGSDAMIDKYRDLELPADGETARVVTILSAGYASGKPPRPVSLPVPAAAQTQHRGPFGLPRPRGVRWGRALLAPALLVVAFAGFGIAWALGITNLGKPTNDVSYVASLGNFRHTGDALRQGGKPEVLFIGGQRASKVEPERWALVKALSQFGTFSGMTAWPDSSLNGVPLFPAFNLTHMVYSSRYIAFVNKDLVNSRFRPLKQKLSRQERALFDKYSNPFGRGANLYAAASNGLVRQSGKSLPLTVVGGYVQAWPTLPVADTDFQTTKPAPPSTPCSGAMCVGGAGYTVVNAPFSDIQKSLQTGHAVNGLPQSLVTNVNAESNIITALVCHADGGKPSKVCGRAIIRKLLKKVR